MNTKHIFRFLFSVLATALLLSACGKDEDLIPVKPDDDTPGEIVLASPVEAPFLFEGMTNKIGNGQLDDWGFLLLNQQADTFIVSGHAYEAPEGTHINFTLPEGLPCNETYIVAYAFGSPNGKEEVYSLGYPIHLDEQGQVQLLNSFSAAQQSFGEGTAQNPYLISCLEDFVKISTKMIEQNITFEGVHFALLCDINCDSPQNQPFYKNGGMNPVGFDHTNDKSYPFAGQLHGRGYTISNMKLSPSGNRGNACLIHELGGNGLIDSLNIKQINIYQVLNALDITAGLVGVMDGNATISHCAITSGEIKGSHQVGGLVGVMRSGHILHSQNHASIISTGNIAGGIVGHIQVKEGGVYELRGLNCQQNVSGGDQNSNNVAGNYGGIAGFLSYAKGGLNGPTVTFEDDTCSAQISGKASIGGIVGGSNVSVAFNRCIQLGYITGGAGTSFGGIVGAIETNGPVTFNSCKVNGDDKTQATINASSPNLGGLGGWIKATQVTADDCKVMNINVINSSQNVGGLIGSVILAGNGAKVTLSKNTLNNCHINASGDAGGLIGHLEPANGNLTGQAVTVSGDNKMNCEIAVSGDTSGGLFGYTGPPVTIESGVVMKGSVSANRFAGGYIGYGQQITIKGNGKEQANSSLTVIAKEYVAGGLVGYALRYVTITNMIHVCSIGNNSRRAQHTGGFVGLADGGMKIENCTFKGTVTGGEDTGGLLGKVGGGRLDLYNCANEGSVNGTNYTGGIIGGTDCDYSIAKATNRGTVNGGDHTGGILGHAYRKRTIDHCINLGNVNGKSRIGGILGATHSDADADNELVISYCQNRATVIGSSNDVAGIAGYAAGRFQIFQTFNTGFHQGTSEIGSIVGRITGGRKYNYQKIYDCYNTANSEGGSNRGGLIGYKNSDAIVGTLQVDRCYNIGSTGWGLFGGIDYRPSYDYHNVYYTNNGSDYSYVSSFPNWDIGNRARYGGLFTNGNDNGNWVMKAHPELVNNRETSN